jgi:predicted phage terminase large subunit-like protein
MSALPSITLSDKFAALSGLAKRSLQDFVPLSTKGYAAPTHLTPLTAELEAVFLHKRKARVVCHAPPRHGKTDTVLRFIAWCIWQNPKIRIAYCTYGADLSHEKARAARDLAVSLGVRLATERVDRWTTAEGGGMWSTGVMGPLTGKGFDIIIIDDPFKNRVEAESPGYRDRVREWFRSVARTRLEPGGSVVVFATRWHPDDLSGTLIKEGYKFLHLPAISDEGEALWPERFDVAALRDIEKDVHAYTWESLYQGRPRPRGATVFKGPKVYTTLPTVYEAGFGVDLAYSIKTNADHSAVVKMLKHGGFWYVTYAHRAQVRARIFKKRCRKLHRKEPTAPWLWYGATTEAGAADLFNEGPRSVPLQYEQAKGDKLVRALRYSDKWNRGRVLVPASAPWLDEFIAEHMSFTGMDDDEDDQVDAATAAFDLLDDLETDVLERPLSGKRTGLAARAM